MTTAWRIIDSIGFNGRLASSRGRLYVGSDEVPLNDIAVLLVGPHCLLHESVFERSAAYGVTIVHCDWKGVPVSASVGWSSNSRVALRQKAQAELSVPRAKNAWMRLVIAKIKGQSEVLKAVGNKQAVAVSALTKLVRSGDPSNIEARAARIYWSGLSPESNFRRRPSQRWGFNSFLDYSYAIMRGLCLRGVVAAGLNPSLGVWHHQRSDAYALVDDLIEPFRSASDYRALGAWSQFDSLDSASKRFLASVFDTPFDRSGTTVGTAVFNAARSFGLYVEGRQRILDMPSFEATGENG